MKLKLLILLSFLIVHCSLFIVHCFAQCGEDRWDVKTLSDGDTVSINFDNIIKTSVSEQVKLPKPEKMRKNSPRRSDETSAFSIDCYIIGFKREKDMDIHIMIKDMQTAETMVAEYPSPFCPEVKETSHYKQLVKLNQWFLDNIGKPTSLFKTLKRPIAVTLTGVGFFDFVHGQKGMAANGREIHPVLSMKLYNKK